MTTVSAPLAVSAPASTTASASTTSSSSTSAATKNAVDYNSFLELLVQEMKNQDPTNPSDPTQYLSQIASFSNVQQATQTNATLTSMLATTSLTQAEGLVGKTVTSSDGSRSGQVTSVALGSGGAATATLADGTTMPIDNTIRVGAGAAAGAGS